MNALNVLMVEDNPNDAELLAFELERGGYEIHYDRVDDEESFRTALQQPTWDIIFSDHSMPNFSSTRALEIFKTKGLEVPFIIVSGTIGEDVAVQALKSGANDYLIKGNLARLLPAVERELGEAQKRKQYQETQASLVETETRFIATFEQAAVGIAHVGRHGDWIRLNQKYCEILGYTHEELMGKTFKDMTHPDDLEEDILLYQKLQEKEFPYYSTEKRYIRKDQTVVWVHLTVSVVWTDRGTFDYAVAVIEDITRRKQMEETLIRAKETAEIANRQKSEFLSLVTHELRTPLNAIIGYSQMMEAGIGGSNLNDKDRKYIHNVVISGQHLLDLINEILDVSKIEAGKMQLTREWVEISHLIETAEVILEESARKNDITFHFEIQPDIGKLYIDPLRFKQILFNLLGNAIKFNRQHGQVTLQAFKSEDGNRFVCRIRDTGIGIPTARISELFQPFSQLDSSYARKAEGTGLGLALTKHLIELHGGQVDVDSQEGIGSTFTFQLPLTQDSN